MEWLDWRRFESEALIVPARFGVLCMNGKRANSGDLGGGRRSSHRIFHQSFSNSSSLELRIYSQTSQNH